MCVYVMVQMPLSCCCKCRDKVVFVDKIVIYALSAMDIIIKRLEDVPLILNAMSYLIPLTPCYNCV